MQGPSGPRHRYPEHHIPLERRDSETSDLGSKPRSQWAKEENPRDTAILLESLPSKQLGKIDINSLSHNPDF